MSEEITVKYGWYSEKQRKVAGLVEYKSTAGESVLVTCVSDSLQHSIVFDDVEPRGEVTQFVRRIEYGILSIWTPERVLRSVR